VVSSPRVGRIESLRSLEIVLIAAGLDHSVALSKDNRIFAWGLGADGQLGVGEIGDEENFIHTPTEMRGLKGHDIMHVTCGPDSTMFLTTEGRIFATGNSEFGQIGEKPGTYYYEPVEIPFPEQEGGWVDMACGGHHVLALTDKGKVYSWGAPNNGRLGHSPNSSQTLEKPHEIEYLRDKQISSVVCGSGHSICISESDSVVYSFGFGGDGRLGHNSIDDMHEPAVINDLCGKKIRFGCAGVDHNLFLVE